MSFVLNSTPGGISPLAELVLDNCFGCLAHNVAHFSWPVKAGFLQMAISWMGIDIRSGNHAEEKKLAGFCCVQLLCML